MVVHVRLFAALREAAGAGQVEATAGPLRQVLDELDEAHGSEFARIAGISTAMLDGERIRDPGRAVPDGAELSLLPPVSGGAQDVRDLEGAPRPRPRPRSSRRPASRQGAAPAQPAPAPPRARSPVGTGEQNRRREGWRPGDDSAVPATGLLLGVALTAALFLGPGATVGVILAVALLALFDGAGVLAARGSRPLVPAAAIPVLAGPLLVAVRGAGWGTFVLCLVAGAIVACLLVALTRRTDAPEALVGTAVLGLGVGLASTGLARLALGPLGATGVAVLLILTCLAGSARTVGGWLRLPVPLRVVAVAGTVVASAVVLTALGVSASAAPLVGGAVAVVLADLAVAMVRGGRYPHRAVGQGAVLAAAGTMGLAAPVLAVLARYLG